MVPRIDQAGVGHKIAQVLKITDFRSILGSKVGVRETCADPWGYISKGIDTDPGTPLHKVAAIDQVCIEVLQPMNTFPSSLKETGADKITLFGVLVHVQHELPILIPGELILLKELLRRAGQVSGIAIVIETEIVGFI